MGNLLFNKIRTNKLLTVFLLFSYVVCCLLICLKLYLIYDCSQRPTFNPFLCVCLCVIHFGSFAFFLAKPTTHKSRNIIHRALMFIFLLHFPHSKEMIIKIYVKNGVFFGNTNSIITITVKILFYARLCWLFVDFKVC